MSVLVDNWDVDLIGEFIVSWDLVYTFQLLDPCTISS